MNKEYEEYIKEKTKPLRKKLNKIKQQAKSIEMPITDNNNKEVKFMNFIKKIEEDNGTQSRHSFRRINSTKTMDSDDGKGPRILSTIKSQTEKLSRNSNSSIKKSRTSTEPLVRPESAAGSMSTAINYDQVQIKKDESESIRKDETTPVTTPSGKLKVLLGVLF